MNVFHGFGDRNVAYWGEHGFLRRGVTKATLTLKLFSSQFVASASTVQLCSARTTNCQKCKFNPPYTCGLVAHINLDWFVYFIYQDILINVVSGSSHYPDDHIQLVYFG
jgi:hypothetical protein